MLCYEQTLGLHIMTGSLKKELSKRASEILSELGVTDCDVIFTDFSEIARDPIKKAQGYHPEFHAHCDPIGKVIEINTAMLQKQNLFHWRNWDNIFAHEVGHIILNTPGIITRQSDDYVGLVLARYQFELYNMAQDLTIPLHILPEKYTDFDLSRITPWRRYSEVIDQVRDSDTRWGLQLGIVEKLPFYYGYGQYDSGEEGARILREVNRILIQEPVLRSIALDTKRLVKPFTMGKDSRETDLQRLVDQGFEFLRLWIASQGKW